VLGPRERLEIELNRLLALYTDAHPQVQSVRRQIAALSETGENGEPATAGSTFLPDPRALLENEIATRKARLEEIDAEVRLLEEKVSLTPEITEEFQALEREEKILQESYTEYLRKLKNAELSRSMEVAQQGAQLVKLESARAPSGPIIPRFLFTLGALVAAVAISLLVAVAREILNPVVIDSSHLEQITSLPSLGSIPQIS
jgi:uncharacterized protein involved in exopolysaccharide biosynthesis